MNNQEINSINDFDFNLICEYFSSVDRQGPGSTESTHKALSYIPSVSPLFRIADIGCGTGSSAIQLAKETKASVLAIDLFPQFLEKVKKNACQLGQGNNVTTLLGDMTDLKLAEESLDLIWSEGAIYNIGFEKGFREWRHFLKKGGFIAVTDASWVTDSRPSEIEDFWVDAYPQIDTQKNNIAKLESASYRLVASFAIPKDCWTTNYYEPQKKVQEAFLERHANNFTAKELIRNQRHEVEMFNKYNMYYDYVWYIAQKI